MKVQSVYARSPGFNTHPRADLDCRRLHQYNLAVLYQRVFSDPKSRFRLPGHIVIMVLRRKSRTAEKAALLRLIEKPDRLVSRTISILDDGRKRSHTPAISSKRTFNPGVGSGNSM